MRDTTITIDPSQYGREDADGDVWFSAGETFVVDVDNYIDLSPLFDEDDAKPMVADLIRVARELRRPVPNVQEALILIDRAMPTLLRAANIKDADA